MSPLKPTSPTTATTATSNTSSATGPATLANATPSQAMSSIANAVTTAIPMQHPGKLESTQPHTMVDWPNAQAELKSTSANANPSWKVTDPNKPGSPVWVKAVGGGGERVEVADKAAQALGLQSPNTRVVDRNSPEGQAIHSLVSQVPFPSSYDPSKGPELLDNAKQFLIGENVEGKPLKSLSLEEKKEVMTDPGFLKDFGKMLALDNAATNNIDRVTEYQDFRGDQWQLNVGNFLVTPGQGNGGKYGISTIDNEYVMPASDALNRGSSPKPGIETAQLMATGKAIVKAEVREEGGLGMQQVPNSGKALANPQAFAEQALGEMNKEMASNGVAPLSSEQIHASARIATQGFEEAKAQIPQLNHKLYGSADEQSKSGNPLMNNETLAAKAAYATLSDPKKLKGNSQVSNETAKIQQQQMFEVKQERFVATSESLKNLQAPGQYPATASKSELTKAVQAESSKLTGYLSGFNNQGVALDYQKALGKSGFVDGIKANYESFAEQAKAFPGDKKLQQAVSRMGEQMEELTALMQPVTNRRLEDNPQMLSPVTNYGKNLS